VYANWAAGSIVQRRSLPKLTGIPANLSKDSRRDGVIGHPPQLQSGSVARPQHLRAERRHSQQEGIVSEKQARYRYSAEFLADIRRRYEETDEPVGEIAADMGMRPSSLLRKAKKLGWMLRKDRPPRELPAARRTQLEAEAAIAAEVAARQAASHDAAEHATAGEAANDEPGPPADVPLVERLEQVIERELHAVEIMRSTLGPEPQPAAEAERTARTLATLTATLFKIRRLRAGDALPQKRAAGQGTDETDLPADLDQFRDAVARRIEIFVHSRTGAVSVVTRNDIET
jgi:transposase-like protein